MADPKFETELELELYRDLRRLMDPGLDRCIDDIVGFYKLPAVQKIGQLETHNARVAAVTAAVQAGVIKLAAWSPEYAKASEDLFLLGPKVTALKTRQTSAAGRLGKEFANFVRNYQLPVLRSFISTLIELESVALDTQPSGGAVDVGWQSIEAMLRHLHRLIERRFSPDLVITMSGPGSFAAFLCQSFDARDVPVVACTTFPKREEMTPAHRLFDRAAAKAGARKIETKKWVVYVPSLVAAYDPGTTTLILDDRVVSGHTQAELRAFLRSLGHTVHTAAMIVSTESASLVDAHGQIIDADFTMPWGSKRGRT